MLGEGGGEGEDKAEGGAMLRVRGSEDQMRPAAAAKADPMPHHVFETVGGQER